MSVLSFGVSFVPLYLVLFYSMFYLGNGFQMFPKAFSQNKDVLKRFPERL